MILKIRSLGGDFPLPEPSIVDGMKCMVPDPNDPQAAMVGVLVLVPEKYRDRCERLAGAISMSQFFPLGFDVKLDPPRSYLNGFWVQQPVFEAVRKENGESSDEDVAEAAIEELELSPVQQFRDPDTGIVVDEATPEDLQVLADAIEHDKKGKAAS